MSRAALAAGVWCGAAAATGQPILVDGDAPPSEYGAGDALLSRADDPDVFSPLEPIGLSARAIGTRVFCLIDVSRVTNLQSGAAFEGELALRIAPAGEPTLLSWAFRSGEFTIGAPGQGPRVAGSLIGAELGPSFAADRFEVSVDLLPLGFQPGDAVVFLLEQTGGPGGDVTLGWSEPIVLGGAPFAAEPVPTGRADGTDVRVATLNTSLAGLLDPQRAPAIGRLLAAVDADVYALQEEFGPTGATLDAFAAAVGGPASAWSAVRFSDAWVLSRRPLHAVPVLDRTAEGGGVTFADDPDTAAAAVELGGGRRIVLYSVHPPLGGGPGSDEDERRIEHAANVADSVSRLRARGFSTLLDDLAAEPGIDGGSVRVQTAFDAAALAAFDDAPVIVAGTWNLLGSRDPLSGFETGAGLFAPAVPVVRGPSSATWRPDQPVPGAAVPERRSIIGYSSPLRPVGGFVLDTALLDVGTRDALGLAAGDSETAGRHLVVVADLRFGNPADVDRDGETGILDVLGFLTAFGSSSLRADLDADGELTILDVLELLANFPEG